MLPRGLERIERPCETSLRCLADLELRAQRFHHQTLVFGEHAEEAPGSRILALHLGRDRISVVDDGVTPQGVEIGDIVVFPNTARYLIHILESASHQIPLDRNLVLGSAGNAYLDSIETEQTA